MIEIYKMVPVLIIYTAILLLAIFYVYPSLKRFFNRKISISIQIGAKEKEKKEKVIQPPKQEKFPSILGKTKFVLSQPLPNAATDSETENSKKKEDTFAPGTEKPEDKKVDPKTGEGIEVDEENEEVSDVDLNKEEGDDNLGIGNMPETEASGIDYNDMGKTAKVVSSPESCTETDEALAGKVLSENQYTDLVKSMQDAGPGYAERIRGLIDKYEQEFVEKQQPVKTSRRKQKKFETEEYEKFNVNDIS